MTLPDYLTTTDFGLSGFSDRGFDAAFDSLTSPDLGVRLSELLCWVNSDAPQRTTFTQEASILDIRGVLQFDVGAMTRFGALLHPTLDGVQSNVRVTVSRFGDGVQLDGQLYLGHLLAHATSASGGLQALAEMLRGLAAGLDATYLGVCDEDDPNAFLPNGLWLPGPMMVMADRVLPVVRAELERAGATIIANGEAGLRVVWLRSIPDLLGGVSPSPTAIESLRSYLEAQPQPV